ncbi:inverse autotransporter beta domain-containing protein, partial [Xenorhabdus beddingii]|uniref:inverse autotransporter beta domain-containing protein n=1 Tax=Xenorhabdus beddingii TaxID=40578 RepID=UPI001ABF1480
SSPAELAEQAKSYALGKFNRTVASEAQKWLSQFGSARINFGLDKKGTLENNSLDILLPLYDNKTDWLLFSQLGYRNKDSRNTLNAGLGGRYFQQNWMYGLNIFYDHDLTGKNQRLGLGGEIWGDYIKLSANTYWRLSDWQNSQSLKDYHERPANGYDINGEFFLPAYPNLGAKLSYEQYFGDNVTLFNRDTRQNNPSLAKLGLTYTPIPLFTLGVDYKQGGSGHTETQFLANLNYKFGIPLSTQLSPDNITSMRTLAGSRYDLVERNNTIVLEHQKKPIAQLSLPKTITGYSREQHDVTVKISSHTPVKQIHWATNQDFENHGGKLSSNVGQTIKITLPNYLSDENRNNHYPIYALAEWEDNQKSAPVQMNVIVRPFKVKTREEANFTPPGPLPATGHKEDGYLFDPVITFDTVNHAPIKNAAIDNVQWITDPKTGSDSGLQFIDWEKSAPAALDENGHFKRKPVLTSTQPHQDVKVYLQLDGQPQQLVGEVSFNENPASFYADKVEVSPQVPSLVADGTQTYTYSATILGSDNKPVKNQKIADVQWDTNKKEIAGLNLKWESTTTDNDGKLTAGLTSTVPVNAVTVSLVIGNHKPVSAKDPVSFTANTPIHRIQDNALHIDPPGPLTADGHHYYTYTAVIVDQQNNPVKNHKMPHVKWRVMQGNQDESTNKKLIWQPKEGDVTTDGEGKLTATLGSNYVMDNLMVSLSIENHGPVSAPSPVSFTADTQSYHIKDSLIDVDPKNNLTADGVQKYTYTAVILDRNNQPV